MAGMGYKDAENGRGIGRSVAETVDREHVDADGRTPGRIPVFDQHRPVVVDLRERIEVFGIVFERVNGCVRCGEFATETLVVGTRHHHVHVVVPRDKTLVPDGAEKRTSGERPA